MHAFRFRSFWLLVPALAAFALSAHAAQVSITITGNWGTISTGPGLATTPFDNGSAFTFTTTITSFTPISTNPGETQLPTTGGSYTNGSTAQFVGLEELELQDPSQWNGQDFGWGVHDVYFVGDFMDLYFNGPQLFSGPNTSPTVVPGSYSVQSAWYGFSARYYNGVGYSTVVLNGDGNITIAALPDPSVPEPSSAMLLALSAGPAMLIGRALHRRRIEANHTLSISANKSPIGKGFLSMGTPDGTSSV